MKEKKIKQKINCVFARWLNEFSSNLNVFVFPSCLMNEIIDHCNGNSPNCNYV